jgi:hypothetical protein
MPNYKKDGCSQVRITLCDELREAVLKERVLLCEKRKAYVSLEKAIIIMLKDKLNRTQ